MSRRSGGGAAWNPGAFGPNLQWWHYDDHPDREINTTPTPDTYIRVPNVGLIEGDLEQTTEALQPDLDSLNSRAAAKGLGSEYWKSDQAAANFAFMHDGTGMSVAGIFHSTDISATRGVLGTSIGGGANIGMGLVIETTGRFSWAVGNGSASVASLRTGTGVIIADTTYIFRLSYLTGRSPDFELEVNALGKVTIDESNTPSASAPLHPLHILSRGNGVGPNPGYLPELICINRLWTASEYTNVGLYLAEKGGVTL